MPICQAVTAAHRPCPCKARDGFTTCGRHKNAGVLVIDLDMCGQEKSDGSRCSKRCTEGDTMCKLHRTIADRREQTRRGHAVWNDTLDFLWAQGVITDYALVRAIPDAAFDAGWITQDTYDHLLLTIRDEWLWYRGQRGTAAKATTDLQRLALDNQNVHTKEVNQLTSDSMKFLLETPVPVGQETVAELETAWSDKSSAQRKKVMRDVKMWYGMKTCVKDSDWLYKKMLDGLWVRIKQHKEREELTKRLWEEAFESVEKCCQGHLSRLANVLVGFTEEVKAEVPVGEILQQRISAIAAKEIGVEFKVCEAWAVFEELKVPMEERDAWIEAF
jgi:hypothetical protein